MINDWSDEAQLRDINHIRHRDGSREAAWVVILVCVAGIVFLIDSELSGILLYLAGLVVVAVGACAGLLAKRWIGGMGERERAAMAIEQREERTREQVRQIAEMKAREVDTAPGTSGRPG